MTVPDTPRRAGPFAGNGVSTAFPFAFKIFEKADIAVLRTDADATDHYLTLDSDYSVTVNADQEAHPGGVVLYPLGGAPLPAGEKLTIIGALPYDQVTDLPTGGDYRAQVVEDAIDRIVKQIQQLDETVGREVQSSPSDPGGSLAWPPPEGGKVIGWNPSGTALQNYTLTGGGSGGLGYFNVRDYGAVGDGTTDDRAAIQAAIDAAKPTGGVVYFPDGFYRISAGLVLSYAGEADYRSRVSFLGSNFGTCGINADAGNFTALTMQGGTAGGTGVWALQSIKSLRIRKGGTDGCALRTDNVAYLYLEDVTLGGGADEWIATDTLIVTAIKLNLAFGTRGLTASLSDWAPPNAWTFVDLSMGDNTEYGMLLTDASAVSFFGGNIEGNGLDAGTSMSSSNWAVKAVNPGRGGGVGLVMNGVYIENNGGIADVLIVGSNSDAVAANTFTGCSFARVNAVRYTKHNVLVDSTAAGANVTAMMFGCGFKSFNDYPTDAARPYLHRTESGGGVASVGWSGCLFEDAVELPTIPNAMASGSVDTSLAYTWTNKHVFQRGTLPATVLGETTGVRIGQTTPTGGSGTKSPLAVEQVIPAGTTTNERAVFAHQAVAATSGAHVAVVGESWASGGSGPQVWGGAFEARDISGDSGLSGVVGLSGYVYANGSAGAANRAGLSMVFGRHNAGGSTNVVSRGVELSASGNNLAEASLTNAIQVGLSANALLKVQNFASMKYLLETETGNVNYFLRTYSGQAIWVGQTGVRTDVGKGGILGGLKIVVDGTEYCIPVFSFYGASGWVPM